MRPTPTSPFKRSLMPAAGEEAASPASVNPRGNHFTPLPAMAEVTTYPALHCPAPPVQVRSPDALHPSDGPCDCLAVPPQLVPHYHTDSTEELNNEMRNLESVMKDLNAIAPGQAGSVIVNPGLHHPAC